MANCLQLLGNIIWIIFGGLFESIAWLIIGIFFCITIIGIPFGLQCFKIAMLVICPFGKEIEYSRKSGCCQLCGNIIWILLCGLFLGIFNLIAGCIYCITIIGIPFGLQFFKLAKLSLIPFGAKVVESSDRDVKQIKLTLDK